jgi:hypothetical protein
MRHPIPRATLTIALLAALAACKGGQEAPITSQEAPASMTSGGPHGQADRPAANPLRNAYFGDTHVHTSWSPDAFTVNVRVTPDDAYRYALGDSIPHVSGNYIRMHSGPLDFYAVTDHSEYMGVLPGMLDSLNPLSRHPIALDMNSDDPARQQRAALQVVGSIAGGAVIPEFMDPAVSRAMWQRIQETAQRYNQPGTFTTFIGYEWTSNPDGRNLHRNVLFRGTQVTEVPFTSFDSKRPEDLWRYMDAARAQDVQLLAIPHNSNYSDGLMFPDANSEGRPIDRAYAESRIRNEPLVEIAQVKGWSETHPSLSPNDEWAGAEISDFLIAGEKTGTLHGSAPGSYVREALRTGLAVEARVGVNPFKFGVVGSSDTHNAGAPNEESRYFGKIGREDGTPEARASTAAPIGNMFRSWGAAGLAGVWAEENTRESLYDAMVRKETFGTTGPRIRVRFFGGWSYSAADAAATDMVQRGYAGGVPMGSDLPARAGSGAPTFMLWAARDPNSAPLQRMQIVKGWLDASGQTHEQLFDVGCADGGQPAAGTNRCPDNGATVDTTTCAFTEDKGDAELAAFWTDPAFDAAQSAFYYVRVLENPTCRWSTWESIRTGLAAPADLARTLQERAYTSPIWYTPAN